MTDTDARAAVTLEELLKRVEKATGPDRLLDAELFAALVPNPRDPWRYWHADIERPGTVLDGPHDAQAATAPAYAASLDAALALVETRLPGWNIEISHGGDRHAAVLNEFLPPCRRIPRNRPYVIAHRTSTVLAVISALLRAFILIAQERPLPAPPEEEQKR